MTQRLLIRTRADASYGSGHLRRSISLAEGIRNRCGRGVEVQIAAEADQTSLAQLKRTTFPTTLLPAGVTANDDRNLVKQISPDLVLVDLLELEEDRADALVSKGARLIVMADTGAIPNSADIAICGQLLSEKPQPVSPGQKLFYGPDYLVLDDSYASRRHDKVMGAQKRNAQILVCFGGYSNRPAMEVSIGALAKTSSIWSGVTMVTGEGCPDDLISLAERELGNASIIEMTDDMPALLANADLAIIAGGFIKYEAASLGVPMLITSIVDHQVALSEAFVKSGSAEHLGLATSIDDGCLAGRIEALLNDEVRRSEMTECGQRFVDGHGIERICNILFGEQQAS